MNFHIKKTMFNRNLSENYFFLLNFGYYWSPFLIVFGPFGPLFLKDHLDLFNHLLQAIIFLLFQNLIIIPIHPENLFSKSNLHSMGILLMFLGMKSTRMGQLSIPRNLTNFLYELEMYSWRLITKLVNLTFFS